MEQLHDDHQPKNPRQMSLKCPSDTHMCIKRRGLSGVDATSPGNLQAKDAAAPRARQSSTPNASLKRFAKQSPASNAPLTRFAKPPWLEYLTAPHPPNAG